MNKPKFKEQIFVLFFLIFNIATLINGLNTLTGGYSLVEYFSLALYFIFLAISNFILSKSNSIIKSIQYVFIMILSIVSIWILLLPMMTYGEFEATGYALKRLNCIGNFETLLYFVSVISIIFTLVKSLFVKRDNHVLLINKCQLVIGCISIIIALVYLFLLVVFGLKM